MKRAARVIDRRRGLITERCRRLFQVCEVWSDSARVGRAPSASSWQLPRAYWAEGRQARAHTGDGALPPAWVLLAAC
jgi:hypothetical protein